MLKGNKGEWGEIYAFCYLLNSGTLQAADKDLRPIEDVFFPIIKIIREDMSFVPADDKGGKVRVYKKDALIGEYTRRQFEEILKILYKEIPNGERAFEIPATHPFFSSLHIDKLKADSFHKQDIDIQIHDINTGIKPICGFSIKSFLGSNPTLVNAGANTNFIYKISGCDDAIMKEFNGINTRNKLIDRMMYLKSKHCRISFTDMMTSGQFRVNMKFIDTLMPQIIGECLLDFYSGGTGTKSVKDVVSDVSQKDTCKLENPEMYKYKMKLFLCACALGMTPEKDWVGGEDANGGYITVKRDGSVVCYHIYNRSDFYEYLYNYTYFEKGSSSRHKYMTIFESNGEYYMCLNLQIRFKQITS